MTICTSNPCAGLPRYHMCVSGINYYNCSCADGYTRPNCTMGLIDRKKSSSEITSACSSSSCQNGGSCNVTELNNFSCECPSGYLGDRCQCSRFPHLILRPAAVPRVNVLKRRNLNGPLQWLFLHVSMPRRISRSDMQRDDMDV